MNHLNRYVLKQFIIPFLTTFCIVTFVLLMQFLWMYIDEIVGKGLSAKIILEFFYYAILKLILQATPLTILLASIMTFGNLGESLELLSMKAAGISLFKIMRPIIVFVTTLTLGAFVFSNTVEPKASEKLLTMRYDIIQKNPAMNLKEGVFNFDIEGLAIKIDSKDKKTGMLLGLKIYNHEKKNEGNTNVTVADSGIIKKDTLTNTLTLTLYSGTSFRNAKEEGKSYDKEKVPLQRDTFAVQVMVFNPDNELKQTNHNTLWFAKGLTGLKSASDSLVRNYNTKVAKETYNLHHEDYKMGLLLNTKENDKKNIASLKPTDVDSLFAKAPLQKQKKYLRTAISFAKSIQKKAEVRSLQYENHWNNIRKHDALIHRRYTIPLSCLIFLFIGAPLGAIVRKGGFGMPVIISIFLFIIWYILDTFGKKMAIEGISATWTGMWMSTFVLTAIGIFLTYQAATDRASINIDSYIRFIKKASQHFIRKR